MNPQAKPQAQLAPETFRINVSPAAEPSPALKYRLVTPYLDREPGNAVPFYYRAVVQLLDGRREDMKKYYDNEDRWLEAPLAKMPRDEVRTFLSPFGGVFEQLKKATRRERVDWDWRMQDLKGNEPIEFLLAEVQEMRTLARLLRLKARLEIAEGRYEDAVETLRTGFALARAAADPPTLINDLVGIAIAMIMHAEVRELIAASDSPNLYWALSELPAPLIPMRESLRHELSMPMQMFPFLRDAETADHSPDEWRRILREGFRQFLQVTATMGEDTPQLAAEGMAQGFVLMGYSRAKQELIAAGYDRKRVESMPVAQVAAIYQARLYRHIHDEMLKWTFLPYSESGGRREPTEKMLIEQRYLGPPGHTKEIVPIASMLMPAVFQALEAQHRLETRTAGLRAVEAIRMQAAANDGRLPASFEEVTVVPVPLNPRDGKPFPYRVEDNTAVLEVPGPENQPKITWRFELTLRKATPSNRAPQGNADSAAAK
ncbi:MAG: hypothetical protein KY476_17510 [Planctomycetes bacterium]|nr:hypothetical protein [Planctomycetota bacterium]